MIIDNVKVYTEEKTFVKGGIMLDGDKIQRVYAEEEKPQFGEKEVLDGEGAYAIPGLIDLHFHGCKGDDFCDGNEEAIERIAQYEASIGVTAIAPATMTLPVEELIRKLNRYGRPVVFLGDGVPVYEEMIEAGMEVPYSFAPAYMNRQRAAVVGSLGICYYREGKFETAAEHKPDYLRISQAERERAEKEKNAKPEVRGMTIEDGAAVAEMEHQSFSDAWSEKAVLETLRQPTALCLVAEKAGRRVGYLLAYQAADEIEIARVAVVEEVKRQGVGTALMKKLQEEGTQRKARKILLDVREKNHMAQAFYEKIGFKEDGIRKRFYTEPEEDAVLMSMQISG